jgi:hypothetical protein
VELSDEAYERIGRIADILKTTRGVVLSWYVHDLVSSEPNSGSDERRMAKEYLLRSLVGDAHDQVDEFLSGLY